MAIVLGITGGIATGKSTVTEMFRELGAETLSADVIAREVLEPGTPGLERIAREFGKGILMPDGSLDRGALAEIVFRNPEALSRINSITHPLIIERMERFVDEFRGRAGERAVLAAEIPLLVECGLSRLVDKVVVVAAEQDTQMSRLKKRGHSTDEAARRLAAQLPMVDKLACGDWVVRTDTSMDATRRQVEEIWQSLAR
jgi:dephospho-CoA kinase